MLINVLNDCIIDMNTVKELETASADTKKQAAADYNFKMLVKSLKKMIDEIQMAINESDFKPSLNSIVALKGFVNSCEKIITVGAANESATSFIKKESEVLYANVVEAWMSYYEKTTKNILSLLETIKGIAPDKNAQYAINKIKKASSWNTEVTNLKYLSDGLNAANQIIDELSLDENIEAFLRLVADGKATILDLSQEILDWIAKEQIADKLSIKFVVS